MSQIWIRAPIITSRTTTCKEAIIGMARTTSSTASAKEVTLETTAASIMVATRMASIRETIGIMAGILEVTKIIWPFRTIFRSSHRSLQLWILASTVLEMLHIEMVRVWCLRTILSTCFVRTHSTFTRIEPCKSLIHINIKIIRWGTDKFLSMLVDSRRSSNRLLIQMPGMVPSGIDSIMEHRPVGFLMN